MFITVLLVAALAVAPDAGPPLVSPCASVESHQLDFWLGDWSVEVRTRDPSNPGAWTTERGENHVHATLGHCAVEESFRAEGGAQPWAGHSLAAYDPIAGEWRQTWVDDSGSYLAFRGGEEKGTFALYGEPRTANGVGRQMRMVFQARQRDSLLWTWERRLGAGAWETQMEIRYHRQAAPAADVSCTSDPGFHALDFWVGDWKVFDRGTFDGTNHIEKVLGGCAVRERWSDADGSHGESLFYRPPTSSTWRQVWVTDRATLAGGTKEKELVDTADGGALTFEGEVPLSDGGALLDRTRLEPLPDGGVHQRIERSADRGATWRLGFDGTYVR